MAVRDFDGTGDYIDFSLGACTIGAAEPFCFGGVIKREADNAYHAMVSLCDASNSPRLGVEITNGNLLEMAFNDSLGQPSTGLTIQVADGWVMWFITCASTTSTPRFHVYKAGAWTHQAAAGIGQSLTGTLTKIRMARWGASSDDYNGRAAAFWIGRGTGAELADATIDGLDGATLATILAALPANKGGWELNQGAWATAVPDAAGLGADSTAINGNGTIVTGDDPATSIFTMSGGAASVGAPISPLRAHRNLIMQ
jgi:hypothetical protein